MQCVVGDVQWQAGFEAGPVNVGFVRKKLQWNRSLSEFFCLPLSVPLHFCSLLILNVTDHCNGKANVWTRQEIVTLLQKWWKLQKREVLFCCLSVWVLLKVHYSGNKIKYWPSNTPIFIVIAYYTGNMFQLFLKSSSGPCIQNTDPWILCNGIPYIYTCGWLRWLYINFLGVL